MNILIFGFGTAGKYCSEILKNDRRIKKIFIFEKEKLKLKKNKKFKQITYKDFLSNKLNINYAIISTPSSKHFLFAKECIKRKIHVLIEKPFVLRLDDARRLINLSKKNKIKCWTVLQNRYNFATNQMRKTVRQVGVKNISLVDCSLYWRRNEKYYSNNWRGKYSTDGGVLTNQGIHLLDMLIYIFGEIQSFNVIASYNKKKLQAEDLIIINFLHKNKILSSFKATTRANRNYEAAVDVISDKKRFKVKGVSLNSFHYWKENKFINDYKRSEKFKNILDPKGGMGTGHKKILKEFLSHKIIKSSKKLEIKYNYYILKLIHSIYNTLNNRNKNYNRVENKQSILGL